MMPLRVQLPDEGNHRNLISCEVACPVHTDARGYVRAIAEGLFEEAYALACQESERAVTTAETVRHFIEDHLSTIAKPLGSVLDGTGNRYLALVGWALVQNSERHRR